MVDYDELFLSTLPARGATRRIDKISGIKEFLSTLPARGATPVVSARELHDFLISIHAPREGSDTRNGSPLLYRRYFYPRSPRGERRCVFLLGALICEISIHAPREGSDSGDQAGDWATKWISIHAPREGSDPRCRTVPPPDGNFYPRSPRGERRCCLGGIVPRFCISIHAPREGSDGKASGVSVFHVISIHAPREGSDSRTPCGVRWTKDFYPRSPRGERPERAPESSARQNHISIHAPREGSDPERKEGNTMQCISIHAPREGSDSKCAEK